jgi:hypothetical protein
MIGIISIVKQKVPMAQERMSPLRQRMIEDMRIKGMGYKAQKAHVRALKDFTTFLDRSPDTATPDDLRAYQLHMGTYKRCRVGRSQCFGDGSRGLMPEGQNLAVRSKRPFKPCAAKVRSGAIVTAFLHRG